MHLRADMSTGPLNKKKGTQINSTAHITNANFRPDTRPPGPPGCL